MRFTARIASTVTTQIIVAVVGLIYAIVVAKALGPQVRGEFFVLQGYLAVVTQVATLSLHTAMTVCLSRGESDGGTVALIALVFSAVVGVPAAAVTFAAYRLTIGPGTVPASVLLAYFAVVPFVLYKTLCGGILLGLHDIRRVNILSLVDVSASTAVTVVGIVILGLGLTGALLAVAVSNLAVALWAFVQVPVVRADRRIREYARSLIDLGWRQHTAFVISQLYLRADAFILPAFVAPAAIGQYAVARGLADRVLLAISPVSQVMFPLISSAADGDARLYTRTTVRLMFVLGLVAALGLAAAAPFLVTLLFGAVYQDAIPRAQVLALATAAFAIQVPLSLWFVGSLKRPLLSTKVALTTLAGVLVLGSFLSALSGTRGMAASMLLSFAISSAVALWLASRAGLRFTPVLGTLDEYRAFWRSVRAPRTGQPVAVEVTPPIG